MPSPVGHSLGGFSVYLYLTVRRKGALWLVVFCVLVTNLPDLDFLPGWLAGEPNLFHRGGSHSIFVALVVGVVAGLVAKLTGKGKFIPVASAAFVLYGLHLVLDLFCVDNSTPRGFQMLWPLNDDYYIAPMTIFGDITRSPVAAEFFQSLFSAHNFRAVINEIVLFLPPLMLLWGIRGRGVVETGEYRFPRDNQRSQ